MAFGVGEQPVTGLEHGDPVAQRRERVLQGAAAAPVHVHIARGHQGQAGALSQGLQAGELAGIVGPAVQLDRQPAPAGKALGEPAGVGLGGLGMGNPQGQAVGHHGGRRQAFQVAPVELISAFRGAPPAQGDERREVAVAGPVAGQQDQPESTFQGEFSTINQFKINLFWH